MFWESIFSSIFRMINIGLFSIRDENKKTHKIDFGFNFSIMFIFRIFFWVLKLFFLFRFRWAYQFNITCVAWARVVRGFRGLVFIFILRWHIYLVLFIIFINDERRDILEYFLKFMIILVILHTWIIMNARRHVWMLISGWRKCSAELRLRKYGIGRIVGRI